MRTRGSTAGTAFMLLLFVLLGISLYYLFTNLTAQPESFQSLPFATQNENIEYHSSRQFYDNMRFPQKQISYDIEPACGQRTQEAQEVFDLLESQTVLSFYPVTNNAEITILCSDLPDEPAIDAGYFVAGEGGPTQVINTSLYAVILDAKVSLFREEKCNEPKIALHEILHALGFDHDNNPNSILYPTLAYRQTIPQDVINDINALYERDAAADLKIEKVSAQKTGRYLNFEIEIANQGLLDVASTDLTVFHNGEAVVFEGEQTSLPLGSIEVGTKKILSVTNARIDRGSDHITFAVDAENKITELFEENNQLELVLTPTE